MNQLELFANEHYILFSITILLLIIWVTVLKGFALWKSARLGSKWWFVALLIVNTMGILELLYLFIFSKENTNETEEDAENLE